MLNVSIANYTHEVADSGAEADVLEVKGSKGKALSVTELRDYLNELIAGGYGEYGVEADTQDGATYSVHDEVLVYSLSKKVVIF